MTTKQAILIRVKLATDDEIYDAFEKSLEKLLKENPSAKRTIDTLAKENIDKVLAFVHQLIKSYGNITEPKSPKKSETKETKKASTTRTKSEYEQLTVKQLTDIMTKNNIKLDKGTGKNGAILKADRIKAIEKHGTLKKENSPKQVKKQEKKSKSTKASTKKSTNRKSKKEQQKTKDIILKPGQETYVLMIYTKEQYENEQDPTSYLLPTHNNTNSYLPDDFERAIRQYYDTEVGDKVDDKEKEIQIDMILSNGIGKIKFKYAYKIFTYTVNVLK